MICAAGQAQICFETGECFAATPYELQVPDFILIDTKKRTVSTTEASGANRSTVFTHLKREDGLISLQGVEQGRAFSFVIDELTGRLTAAIAAETVMRKVQRALRTGLIEADTPEEQIDEAVARAIIDEDEASRLRAADAARYDAIMVDEFPPEDFGRGAESGAVAHNEKGRISA